MIPNLSVVPNIVKTSRKTDRLLMMITKIGSSYYDTAVKYYGEYAINFLFKKELIEEIKSNNITYLTPTWKGMHIAKEFGINFPRSSQLAHLEHDCRLSDFYCQRSQEDQDSWMNEAMIKNHITKYRERNNLGELKEKIYLLDGQFVLHAWGPYTTTLIGVESIGNYTNQMKDEKRKFAEKYYEEYIELE